MKKILLPLLAAFVLMFVFSACGNSSEQPNNTEFENTTASTTSTAPTVGSSENTIGETAADMVDPYDGTKLEVDTSWNGTVASDAPPVGNSTVVINNVEYDLPFAVKLLFDNGWTLAPNVTFPDSFAANADTSLSGLSLYYENRDYLSLRKVHNSSDSPADLESCSLTELTFNIGFYLKMEKTFSLVLPGGITADSSAADVIAVFGPAENNENFGGVSVLNNQVRYMNSKNGNLAYHFTFNDDGSIYSISVEWEGK